MTLSLRCDLLASTVDFGSAISVRLTLTNTSDETVEVASLADNNTITNYELSSEDDRVLGVYNHVTRQQLFEKSEPRVDDQLLITLPPGGHEERDYNFCLLHWIERPGTYLLRGLYRWQGHEVRSGPASLSLLPAKVSSLDHQWAYHYGAKFHLQSAWTVETPEGNHELVLRESARFRPQVLNYNPVVLSGTTAPAPRIAFNRSQMAGGATWLAWIDGDAVVGLRTGAGEIEGGPYRIATQLTSAFWAAAPITSEAGDLAMVLAAPSTQEDGATQILGLRIDSGGTEVARAAWPGELNGVRGSRGVTDIQGRFFLLAHTEQNNLWCWEADLETMEPKGAPRILWHSENRLLGVFTPPALNEDGWLVCLCADSEVDGRLHLVWLSLFDSNTVLKEESFSFEGAERIERVWGEMNEGSDVFVLLRTDTELRYLHGGLMQSIRLASDTLPSLDLEQLTINHRNDVFLTAFREDHGVIDRVIHRGGQDDSSEWGL